MENKTAVEILRSICNYKHEDKIELSDDITIEEALEAMKEYTALKEKEIEALKAILKIGNKHEAIRKLKVKDKEQQSLIADCLQRNAELEKANNGIWNNACKTLLTDISKMFKNNSHKADKESDKDVFQAIAETIINFPIPSPPKH